MRGDLPRIPSLPPRTEEQTRSKIYTLVIIAGINSILHRMLPERLDSQWMHGHHSSDICS